MWHVLRNQGAGRVHPASVCLAALLATTSGWAQSAPQPDNLHNPAALLAEQPQAFESLDDAWWTGPLLTASADVLDQGHVYLEPYVFDIRTARSTDVQSATYIDFGMTDKLTVGVAPVTNFDAAAGKSKSLVIGAGDFSVSAQYQLASFDPVAGRPAASLAITETFPTGKYDRLGNGASNGGGAYVTNLGLYAQTYLWMPSGRILRARINLFGSVSSEAVVKGVSAYGTGSHFNGQVAPGMSFGASMSGEYSVTRKIVLALDLGYQHQNSNQVFSSKGVCLDSGGADSFTIAPAIEYNFSENFGVLLGVRITPGSHGTPRSLAPAIALSMYF